ncbi:MAG TPA: bifunctional helix-turn-helix transcriptional regulator/GNAT family N-acetyltransferase [Puia sp.]|nr:bifunctional helix-turn-helix transcriptional regulator/GNAT family N-acetyltransferase [Puia sp.]
MVDSILKLGYLAGSTRFRRISEKLHVDGDKIYKDQNIDFKASWFSVYYILANTEGPKTVLELAEEIGVSHITVKNVVRELEGQGLVKIREHPTDGRSKHISLSVAGRKLIGPLQKIWVSFAAALKQLLDAGHPDFLNIINRVEKEIALAPIDERVRTLAGWKGVQVLDYKPSLKETFYELAGNWLLGVLKGELEEEDQFSLRNPDKAYLEKGGFVFFAVYDHKVVGCVALKRLDEETLEFAKLFIDPAARKLGIATKLIERCITRCKENEARQLWLQTTLSMPQAHKLYYKLGFEDRKAPPQMEVLKRTEKVMCMDL